MELNELKKIQKVALEILVEIDRVCKKNNIEYILACGTALGAVRHQGFIPWDDDLDIGMTRDNYMRFIEALKKDLGEDFYFHCFEEDKRYNVLLPSMKVRKKGTYILEKNFLLKHHCDGDGLFVDVFVYDHVSDSKIINGLFRTWLYLQAAIIFILDNLHFNPVLLKKFYVKNDIWFSKMNKNSKKWGVSLTYIFNKPTRQQVYDEDTLFPFQMMPFEGNLYPMAHNTDAFLLAEIGDGYMNLPPVEKRISTHTVEFSDCEDQPHKTR